MILEKSQRAKDFNYKHYMQKKTDVLDEKERHILEFIEKNQGTSIQGVVDSARYARKTVYRVIENLVKYEIIIKEVDKKNNRRCQLYINKESVIRSVMNDIKAFKKSYFDLVNLANECYKKIEGRDYDETYSWAVSTNLVFILKHLIMSYSIYAVFEWPKMIRDNEGLNRLYLTVFQSLNDMFSELAKKVPFHLKETDKKLEFLKEDIMFLFQESKEYERMISDFREYNLDKEFDSVMSTLFKASKMPKEWNDYRAAIEEK